MVKYNFSGLCVFLTFWLSCLLAVSCGTEKADVLELAEVEQASGSEGSSKPAGLVLRMEEEPDMILVSYRNPALQEMVVSFFRDLIGSSEVAGVVLSNCAMYDIPPALAFALCWEESRYTIRALNRNRNGTVDRGLFQLNSETFPNLAVEDFYNPGINARHGLAHLRWCLNTAGTEVAALAMYNAGTARVRSVGTPKHTLDYVSRILKRQRKIEELFIAEHSRIAENAETENEDKKRPSFRLSLLTRLGR
jgi:hypothetical protein